MIDSIYRKSSKSMTGDTCVEVAHLPEGVIIRDSKDARRAFLKFTRDSWSEFVRGLRGCELVIYR
ncbi:DUF397 domain-containing protein [Streptomyces sp. NPDC001165]|uniref:DUF397 domain-containing protein n=1 Tax=Streptomyces sp. NPDC001165 TaxID=3364546 RepID=UPI0036CFB260